MKATTRAQAPVSYRSGAPLKGAVITPRASPRRVH